MTNALVRLLEQDATMFVTELERDPLIGRIIRGDAEHDEYVRFLAGTYHYVSWSGVLLARTARGLRLRGRSPALVALVEAKTEEEAPHDRWALNDLRALGVDSQLIKGEPAPAAVVGYVQSHLAWADAGSAAFLGAAYMLEYLSMHRAGEAAKNLRRFRRVPGIERSTTFLEAHGEADVGHVRTLEEQLASLDDEQERAAVTVSARTLKALFALFFAGRDVLHAAPLRASA